MGMCSWLTSARENEIFQFRQLIRHSVDGTAYVIHDEDFSRTTNINQVADSLKIPTLKVSELTGEVIGSLDAGSWSSSVYEGEPVPNLETILDCVNPTPLAIEIKEPDITPDECAVIFSILESEGDNSSVIMSFHREALETWRAYEVTKSPETGPIRHTVLLATEFPESFMDSPYDVLGLVKSAVTSDLVQFIHDGGKFIWVWTVNEDFEKYMMMGVDGIVTDSPDRLRKMLPPS